MPLKQTEKRTFSSAAKPPQSRHSIEPPYRQPGMVVAGGFAKVNDEWCALLLLEALLADNFLCHRKHRYGHLGRERRTRDSHHCEHILIVTGGGEARDRGHCGRFLSLHIKNI